MQFRRCGAAMRWRGSEILAMVLGFMVFWPVGLGVIGWKMWQRRSGYPGDLFAFLREKWQSLTGRGGFGFAPQGWRAGPFGGSTGNRAFDEWRQAELARIEQERQKLAAAEREFAEYMDNLRMAKDREEFERFMNERRGRQEGGV
jgi:hypothetical protein